VQRLQAAEPPLTKPLSDSISAEEYSTAGKVKALVDSRTFTLQSVSEAHDLIEQRRANGKLVLEID
jgi:NADPH:quinone reductase-like Zn-dependent oxidoreductase